ncbi:hypothetical protein MRX96_003764 [Rhipicephalus microplus]
MTSLPRKLKLTSSVEIATRLEAAESSSTRLLGDSETSLLQGAFYPAPSGLSGQTARRRADSGVLTYVPRSVTFSGRPMVDHPSATGVLPTQALTTGSGYALQVPCRSSPAAHWKEVCNHSHQAQMSDTSKESSGTPSRAMAGQSRLSAYLLALRPWSFSASLAPVALGAALAYRVVHHFSPLVFVASCVTALSVHAAGNVVNTYFDYMRGVDSPHEQR